MSKIVSMKASDPKHRYFYDKINELQTLLIVAINPNLSNFDLPDYDDEEIDLKSLKSSMNVNVDEKDLKAIVNKLENEIEKILKEWKKRNGVE